MHSTLISHERLLEILQYDPHTGLFTWRVNKAWNAKAGMRAGSINSRGYVIIRADVKLYKAHRLAWFYFYKKRPEDEIDHKNKICSDNRISNLREATRSQNMGNISRCAVNTTGKKGVTFNKDLGKFCSKIKYKQKTIHLGFFTNLDEAHAAYSAASRRLFGEFSRTE